MIEYSSTEQEGGAIDSGFSVRVIGVGGSGANVLDRMALEGSDDVDLLTLNTDVRALSTSVSGNKIQLGRSLLKGMGAGGDPDLGRQSALEAVDEIRAAVRGYSMVFLCVGLGGGTGSGAAPEVARIAREEGVFLVVFATLPFTFEGKRRMDQALDALDKIGRHANAVVTFENDRMGELIVPKEGVQQAFAAADKVISQSIRATTNIVSHPGIIRIGMDELLSALDNDESRCLFGFGIGKGETRAGDALEAALRSPLLDQGKLLEDARNVLVHVGGGDNMTLAEVETVMAELSKYIDGDRTQILFGTGTDKRLSANLTVTIISSLRGPARVGKSEPGDDENALPVARLGAPESAPSSPGSTLGAAVEAAALAEARERDVARQAAGRPSPRPPSRQPEIPPPPPSTLGESETPERDAEVGNDDRSGVTGLEQALAPPEETPTHSPAAELAGPAEDDEEEAAEVEALDEASPEPEPVIEPEPEPEEEEAPPEPPRRAKAIQVDVEAETKPVVTPPPAKEPESAPVVSPQIGGKREVVQTQPAKKTVVQAAPVTVNRPKVNVAQATVASPQAKASASVSPVKKAVAPVPEPEIEAEIGDDEDDRAASWSDLESSHSIGKLLQQGRQSEDDETESEEAPSAAPAGRPSVRELARQGREQLASQTAPPAEEDPIVVAETDNAQQISLTRRVISETPETAKPRLEAETAPAPAQSGGGLSLKPGAGLGLDLSAGGGGASAEQQRQQMLQLEPLSKGRFAKTEPTIVDGEDMDVPTFLRKRRNK